MTGIRTGQARAMLTREEFGQRVRMQYADPEFDVTADAIARTTKSPGGRKSQAANNLSRGGRR